MNGRQLICESLAINPQVAVSPLKSNGALTEKLVLTCLKSDMLDFDMFISIVARVFLVVVV